MRYRNRMLRPTILISLAILLGGAEQLPGQTHSDSIITGEAGARLYFAYCSACHGSEGNAVPGVDFRSGKFRRASSDDDLMLIVLRGIPGTAMPPNNFGSSELRAIVGRSEERRVGKEC